MKKEIDSFSFSYRDTDWGNEREVVIDFFAGGADSTTCIESRDSDRHAVSLSRDIQY